MRLFMMLVAEFFDDFSAIPGDEHAVGHGMGDDGSGTDDAVLSNGDALDDGAACADPCSLSDLYVAAEGGVGGDVDEVSDDALMINRGGGIDDAVLADLCAGLDDGALHDDAAFFNGGVR